MPDPIPQRHYVEPSHDGEIVDRLAAAIRREGESQRLYDSVPVDLWRRAVRLTRR